MIDIDRQLTNRQSSNRFSIFMLCINEFSNQNNKKIFIDFVKGKLEKLEDVELTLAFCWIYNFWAFFLLLLIFFFTVVMHLLVCIFNFINKQNDLLLLLFQSNYSFIQMNDVRCVREKNTFPTVYYYYSIQPIHSRIVNFISCQLC